MTLSRDILEQFKNVLLDKEASNQIVKDYLSNNDKSDVGNHIPEIVIDLLLHVANSNFEIVHDCSESPIEKIFLGALNYFSIALSVTRNIPPLLLFIEPSKSAVETAQANRKYWVDLWETRHLFKRANPNSNIHDFVDFGITHGMFLESKRDEMVNEIILMQDVGVGSTYRLMPQARFPHLQIDGHSIRTDSYIWKPNDERFNIILECDGFEFHSSKAKFINDRSRDRLLQSQGFDVLRFSGSEINDRPTEVAQEILKKLYQHHQKTWKPV